LNKLKELTTSLNVNVTGLHCHVGSGIFTTKVWSQNAEILSKLIELFPHVDTIDLGGGLGVPYKPEDQPLDLKSLADSLKQFKNKYPKIKLALEPGRYPIAESGVLLAKVTQTKSKGDHMYVGIDCGMNTLLRPGINWFMHF
jgi:diaminopimelate decarboxylase/aspartate kinase